jgi:hypothetical protein
MGHGEWQPKAREVRSPITCRMSGPVMSLAARDVIFRRRVASSRTAKARLGDRVAALRSERQGGTLPEPSRQHRRPLIIRLFSMIRSRQARDRDTGSFGRERVTIRRVARAIDVPKRLMRSNTGPNAETCLLIYMFKRAPRPSYHMRLAGLQRQSFRFPRIFRILAHASLGSIRAQDRGQPTAFSRAVTPGIDATQFERRRCQRSIRAESTQAA